MLGNRNYIERGEPVDGNHTREEKEEDVVAAHRGIMHVRSIDGNVEKEKVALQLGTMHVRRCGEGRRGLTVKYHANQKIQKDKVTSPRGTTRF